MPVTRVGTSGWRYPRWRNDWYPKGLAQRRELEYTALRLSSIEINGSFYSLQRPASYLAWYESTPEDFVFAVKGARFITHLKRLTGVEVPLANFFASGVLALRDKLGPILWQLPERHRFDREQLESFLRLLPRTTTEALELATRHDGRLTDRSWLQTQPERRIRYALEARHPDFGGPDVAELLRSYDVGFVVADTAGRWLQVRDVTSDFVYVRLHGSQELYTSGYTEEELAGWAADIRKWSTQGRDVFVYFDNDAKGRAPFDAVLLTELLRQEGTSA
jgi:uncharacterized protein YecE (DUF72 family)